MVQPSGTRASKPLPRTCSGLGASPNTKGAAIVSARHYPTQTVSKKIQMNFFLLYPLRYEIWGLLYVL